ncbi:hypothetical protein BDZ91DRAFT_801572 [Kalaharituber pfeilii]|nr:hypothetical protein BDZ91DRAFT_801572 [Kalaharituber pfeilii]
MALTIVSFILLRDIEQTIWDLQIVLALTTGYATILDLGYHDGLVAFENEFTTFWRSAVVSMAASVEVYYAWGELPKVEIPNECDLLWPMISTIVSVLPVSFSTIVQVYQIESLIFLLWNLLSTLRHLMCGVMICYLILFRMTSIERSHPGALPSTTRLCLDYLLTVPNTDLQIIVYGSEASTIAHTKFPFFGIGVKAAMERMQYRFHCHLSDHYRVIRKELGYSIDNYLKWREIREMHSDAEIRRISRRICFILALFESLFTVIIVEFRLKRGGVAAINDIRSTGQMMAFVVASGSLLTAFPNYYRATKASTRNRVILPPRRATWKV